MRDSRGMPAPKDTPATGLARLREPFSPSQIGKLPRTTCKTCSDRGTCDKHQKSKCSTCNNYISSAHIHLDFVGHAAVTDRLLEVDPNWTWEPVAFAEDGGPLIRFRGSEAELWIKLTILGVTRYGVGTASGFELPKQLISDALRNAAMRFGVALDLWSKEDLHATEEPSTPSAPTGSPPSQVDPSEADSRNELLESFSALPADIQTKVLDRLRKADLIKRKSAGAIGTVAAEHFDTVRRTLELAHESVAGGSPAPETRPTPASPPPGTTVDGEVWSTEQLIDGIDRYEPMLTPEQTIVWSTWLETEMRDRPFAELTHEELSRAYDQIATMAAGVTA